MKFELLYVILNSCTSVIRVFDLNIKYHIIKIKSVNTSQLSYWIFCNSYWMFVTRKNCYLCKYFISTESGWHSFFFCRILLKKLFYCISFFYYWFIDIIFSCFLLFFTETVSQIKLSNSTKHFVTPMDNSYNCPSLLNIPASLTPKVVNNTAFFTMNHFQLEAFKNSTSNNFSTGMFHQY